MIVGSDDDDDDHDDHDDINDPPFEAARAGRRRYSRISGTSLACHA